MDDIYFVQISEKDTFLTYLNDSIDPIKDLSKNSEVFVYLKDKLNVCHFLITVASSFEVPSHFFFFVLQVSLSYPALYSIE